MSQTIDLSSVYGPLQPNEFRALRFTRLALPLIASLEVLSLERQPVHLALSYTWQAPRGSRWHYADPAPFIIVDGVEIKIQTNLFDALVQLVPRVAAMGIPIFIDALCINQKDHVERSMQVGNMRSIYMLAREVLAWVGTPLSDHEADLAVRMLKRCGSIKLSELEVDLAMAMLKDCDQTTAEPSALTLRDLAPVLKSSEYNEWLAIADLMEEEYWHRTWVLQEITGPAPTTFLYGYHNFSREELVKAMGVAQRVSSNTTLREPLDRALGRKSAIARLALLTDKRRWARPLLLDLCRIARHTSCSDPRDKVFMSRGIARGLPKDVLTVDYSKPTAEVYLELAVYSMTSADENAFGLWRTLGLVAHPQSGPPASIPAWVPDWETPLGDVSGLLSTYNASNRIFRPNPVISGSRLTVFGKRVDTLAFRSYTARPIDARKFKEHEPDGTDNTV